MQHNCEFGTQIKNTQRVASFQDTQKIVRYDMSDLERSLWQHRIMANRRRKSFRVTLALSLWQHRIVENRRGKVV